MIRDISSSCPSNRKDRKQLQIYQEKKERWRKCLSLVIILVYYLVVYFGWAMISLYRSNYIQIFTLFEHRYVIVKVCIEIEQVFSFSRVSNFRVFGRVCKFSFLCNIYDYS